jgi:hypothetical protein
LFKATYLFGCVNLSFEPEEMAKTGGIIYKQEDETIVAIFTAKTEFKPRMSIKLNASLSPLFYKSDIEFFACGSLFIYKLCCTEINKEIKHVVIGKTNFLTIFKDYKVTERIHSIFSIDLKTSNFFPDHKLSLFFKMTSFGSQEIEDLKILQVKAFFIFKESKIGGLVLEKKTLVIDSLKCGESTLIDPYKDYVILAVYKNGLMQFFTKKSVKKDSKIGRGSISLFFFFVVLTVIIIMAVRYFKRQ